MEKDQTIGTTVMREAWASGSCCPHQDTALLELLEGINSVKWPFKIRTHFSRLVAKFIQGCPLVFEWRLPGLSQITNNVQWVKVEGGSWEQNNREVIKGAEIWKREAQFLTRTDPKARPRHHACSASAELGALRNCTFLDFHSFSEITSLSLNDQTNFRHHFFKNRKYRESQLPEASSYI